MTRTNEKKVVQKSLQMYKVGGKFQVVPLPPGITSDDIKQAFYSLAEKNTDRQGRPSPIELTELPKQTSLKQVLFLLTDNKIVWPCW